MPNDIRVHESRPGSTDHPAGSMRRLRAASIAFNAGTLFIVLVPAMIAAGPWLRAWLGVEGPYLISRGFAFYSVWAGIVVWAAGIIMLARDRRLKVLMAFGSRRGRESAARSQAARIRLDEFDFHLRGEAFRISYQIIASLVALVSVAGFLMFGLTDVKVNWNMVLALTFPFGLLWLLALPTSVVVWLIDPEAGA